MNFFLRPRKFGYLALAIPLLAGTLTAGQNNTDEKRVSYTGGLDGTVTVDLTLGDASISNDIAECSSHLGSGTQAFTSLDLTFFPVVSTGTSEATAANGDRVFLTFELFATDLMPTPTGLSVEYQGTYSVVGGTGRFDFQGSPASGDFGNGLITGMAEVDLTQPGVVVLNFANTFEGTIATVGGSK